MLGDSYDGGWRTVATGLIPGTRTRVWTQKRDGCTRTVQNQGHRDSDALSAPQHRVDAPAERHRHAPAGASSTPSMPDSVTCALGAPASTPGTR